MLRKSYKQKKLIKIHKAYLEELRWRKTRMRYQSKTNPRKWHFRLAKLRFETFNRKWHESFKGGMIFMSYHSDHKQMICEIEFLTPRGSHFMMGTIYLDQQPHNLWMYLWDRPQHRPPKRNELTSTYHHLGTHLVATSWNFFNSCVR